MKSTKDVYRTQEQFEKDLEICLTIISRPNNYQPYYVCEYMPAHLRSTSIVHIYVI